MPQRIFPALVCSVCILAGSPVWAADAPQTKDKTADPKAADAKTIDAPDGAFGFADDSGVTEIGKYQATLDFLPSWSSGTMKGRDYGARAEINTGVIEGLQLGVAIAGSNARDMPAGDNVSTSRAFAVSLPGKWQLRAREVDNFGAAIVFEPFIGRQMNRPQPGSLDYGIDAKIALDANLGNRFYATLNFGYALEANAAPVGLTQTTGLLYINLAGTYRVIDGLYVGAQIRQGWQFAQSGPGTLAGQALSLGPTIAWQVNDTLTFSAVYMRQVAGDDPARPSALLDLTNFRQNDARVRMTLSF